ncbi:MAG: hypothetical protein ACXW4H_01215, partial [Candidatus Limnocylindrales bacterium]
AWVHEVLDDPTGATRGRLMQRRARRILALVAAVTLSVLAGTASASAAVTPTAARLRQTNVGQSGTAILVS